MNSVECENDFVYKLNFGDLIEITQYYLIACYRLIKYSTIVFYFGVKNVTFNNYAPYFNMA